MTKVDYLIFCERFQEELQEKIYEPISSLERFLPQIAQKVMYEHGIYDERIIFNVVENDYLHQIIEMEICVDGLLEKSQIYIN